MKKILLLSLLLLFVENAASANSPKNPITPERVFVTKVADEVLAAIKKGGDEKDITSSLRGVFNNYVDLPWVSNFVLGRHARSATQVQKQRFVASYKEFMTKSYASRLKNYSGETYQITSQRNLGDSKAELRMSVNRKEGAPILIDYKIHKVGKDFKIYDMAVEGISLITTQRSEFGTIIERKGLDALIMALENAK
jgi:phospholipid transport system substrate-binding protein